MTVTASTSDSFVGVKLPNVFFKTDKTNPDVVYFEVLEYLYRVMNTVNEPTCLITFTTCMMYCPKKERILTKTLM